MKKVNKPTTTKVVIATLLGAILILSNYLILHLLLTVGSAATSTCSIILLALITAAQFINCIIWSAEWYNTVIQNGKRKR